MTQEALLDALTLDSLKGVYEVFTEHGLVYEVHLDDSVPAAGRMVISRNPDEPDDLEGRHALTVLDMVLNVGAEGFFSLVDLISGAKQLATPKVTAITKIA